MEDYRDDVYVYARGILGELTEDQSDLLLCVAHAVCVQMDSRLRPGVTNSDCRNAYILACALYCVSFLRNLNAEQLSSFTAGTLSLSFSQNASPLVTMAEQLMAPWLAVKPVFYGVSG